MAFLTLGVALALAYGVRLMLERFGVYLTDLQVVLLFLAAALLNLYFWRDKAD